MTEDQPEIDDPLDLLLSQMNRLVASNAALVADNAALKAGIIENNVKTVQEVTAQTTAIEATFKRAEQTHRETLAGVTRTGVRALWRNGAIATTGTLGVIGVVVMVMFFVGQVHVIFGPTAGLCATTPAVQAGGGRACWETPPEDAARGAAITTCVEPPLPVQMSDPSLPDQGRPFCWTGPRLPGR